MMKAPNPYSAKCATRVVLDRIADKWAVRSLGSAEGRAGALQPSPA